MPVLLRYLFSRFLVNFLRILLISGGLFLLLDGAELVRRYAKEGSAGWSDILFLLALRLPAFLVHILAPLTLLATLTTLTLLSRQNEITAMRAGGLSIYRILVPFLLAGLSISSVQFLLQDQVVPLGNRLMQDVVNRITHSTPASTLTGSDTTALWIRDGQQIVHAQGTSPEHGAMWDVTIFQFDEGLRLLTRVDAKHAKREKEGWVLYDGIVYTNGDAGAANRFESRPWPIQLATEQFDRSIPQPEMLSLMALRHQANRLSREGYDAKAFQVFFLRRLADPLTTLSAIILAFPFALRLQRLGGATRSLLLGLVVGFAMFIVVDLTTALGMGSILPAGVAVFVPVIFFFSVGMFLLLHLEEECKAG
ncbi:MAG: LptF/LptG family permease [Magnetococcales bacterium]|nr:LptF/LptG family permease [Magnetococcales bacterium]